MKIVAAVLVFGLVTLLVFGVIGAGVELDQALTYRKPAYYTAGRWVQWGLSPLVGLYAAMSYWTGPRSRW